MFVYWRFGPSTTYSKLNYDVITFFYYFFLFGLD